MCQHTDINGIKHELQCYICKRDIYGPFISADNDVYCKNQKCYANIRDITGTKGTDGKIYYWKKIETICGPRELLSSKNKETNK